MLLPALLSQFGTLGLPVACAYFIASDAGQTLPLLRRLHFVVPLQALTLAVLHAFAIGVLFWYRDPGLRVAALITLSLTPALIMQEYGLAVLQGQQRFLRFNLLRTLPALSSAAVAAVLVYTNRTDVTVVVTMLALPIAVVAGLTAVIALLGSPRVAQPRKVPTLRQLAGFGVKGIVGSSYPVETLRLDQLFVGLFMSAADLGLYVVASSFSSLPRFISQSVGYVAYPHIASKGDPGEQRRAMWRFVLATTALALLTVIALWLLLPVLLPLFFGPPFAAAVPVSKILLIAAALLSMRRILAEAMKGAGNPAAGSIAEVVSLIVLSPALLLFASWLHLVGVGVALGASAAISLAVLLWVDLLFRRRYPAAPNHAIEVGPMLGDEGRGSAAR
jgi:O-antigen/teichoic acid export membrane protein